MIRIEKSTIFDLIHLAELLNNETVKRFTKLFNNNIGISQILVLNELRIKSPQKQSELAEKIGCTPGAMTNIANKLINEEYAERKYSKTDRRLVQLIITKKGEGILVEAQEKGRYMREELYSVLAEEEINQMISIQKKLLQSIKNID